MEGVEKNENNGEEAYDPKKAFAEYLKEKAGQPIDARFVAAGEKELKEGERYDFAVVHEEPSRAEKFKNEPMGELFKTDLSVEELEKKIAELSQAQATLSHFMATGEPAIPNLEIDNRTTFKNFWKAELPAALREASNSLVYWGYPNEMLFSELVSELEEEIRHDRSVLSHLQRQAGESA